MIAIQVISTSLQTATSAKSHAIDTVTLSLDGYMNSKLKQKNMMTQYKIIELKCTSNYTGEKSSRIEQN